MSFLLVTASMFLFAAVTLGGENWKEEQAQMFAQIGLKPGDVIDSSNWQKAEGLLPEGVIAWIKRGDEVVKIGELKYDFAPEASWKDLCAKNEGKYALDASKNVIEKSSNKYPVYVEGDLFPTIDYDNDPDAAIKYVHNIIAKRGRMGNLRCFSTTEWVGLEGRERLAITEYIDSYHYNRPDGEIPNRKEMLQQQLYKFVQPYDIQGLASLTLRWIDPRADSVYSYVPSIRRVKKLSGANRSDPYAGSDFVIDDAFGWAGKNASMKWRIIKKEMICLVQLAEWMAEKPIIAQKQPDGSYYSSAPRLKSAYDVPGAKVAPWIKVGTVWVPRKLKVLEAVALDPYYSYGKVIYHIDPDMGFTFKTIYNRAGEYWKQMVIAPACYEWRDAGKFVRRTTNGFVVGYVVVDEKTHHASACSVSGTMEGTRLDVKFMDPTIRQAMFEPSFLNTWSR